MYLKITKNNDNEFLFAWHARGHRFESVIFHVDYQGVVHCIAPFLLLRFKYFDVV